MQSQGNRALSSKGSRVLKLQRASRLGRESSSCIVQVSALCGFHPMHNRLEQLKPTLQHSECGNTAKCHCGAWILIRLIGG
eukprot:5895978-Amphidinium_carterae.1